jgi:dihydrodipicolinate synthase/N-acetylneuraminate lyase
MNLREHLLAGQAIPAHPLALTPERTLDERRQRALTRYYVAAGAGGIAVGVHTTQFAIREPQHALLKPVLQLASETADSALAGSRPFVKVAGICGRTAQAVAEAELARALGYQAGLLSLSAWRESDTALILAHCRTVADVLPVFGFYLQPAVGGRVLDYAFWREFVEIENVAAIKVAPFNRYQTLEVVRALADSGREDVALYTGNDDNIVVDLLTRFPFHLAAQDKFAMPSPLSLRSARPGASPERREGSVTGRAARIVGGLLGHWAVWTKRAVEMLEAVRRERSEPILSAEWLTRAAAVTDANAAFFDAANGFAGCIAGIHELLRRQGLLRGVWCLDPHEGLSPGQSAEIDRVLRAYPELSDDDFVAAHRDAWLR